MRILAINHEFPPLGGGGANACYYIARELVRQGHEVTVITSHMDGLARREQVHGVDVVRLPCRRRNMSHSTLSEAAWWVARALPFAVNWARAQRPDVVQCLPDSLGGREGRRVPLLHPAQRRGCAGQ